MRLVKNYLRVIRMVSTFGQLGFTLITPPVVMALLGWWLQSRFGLGTWVMLLCLLIGLISAGTSGYRFLKRVLVSDHRKALEEEKEQVRNKVVYYSHE